MVMSPAKESVGELIPFDILQGFFPDLFDSDFDGEVKGANDLPAIAILSEAESKLLKSVEVGLGRLKKGEILEGILLLIIKEKKLYRERAHTWDEYVENRWGIQPRRSYDRTQSAEVYLSLRRAGFADAELPCNMSQCLPLYPFEIESRVEIWQMILDEKKNPTVALIAEKCRLFKSIQNALPSGMAAMTYLGDDITWVSEDGERVTLCRGDRVVPAGISCNSTTQTYVRLINRPETVYQVLASDLDGQDELQSMEEEEEIEEESYVPAPTPRHSYQDGGDRTYTPSRPDPTPTPKPIIKESPHGLQVGDRVILAKLDGNIQGLSQGQIGKIEALKGASASVLFGKRSVLCRMEWLEWCPPIEPGDIFRLVDLTGPNGQHNGFRCKFLEFNKEGSLRVQVIRQAVSDIFIPVRIQNLSPVKECEIHQLARKVLGQSVEIIESRAEAKIARSNAPLFVNATEDTGLASEAIAKFRSGEIEEMMVLFPSGLPKAMGRHMGMVAGIAYLPGVEITGMETLLYFGTDAREFVSQVEAEFHCPVFAPFNPAIEVEAKSA